MTGWYNSDLDGGTAQLARSLKDLWGLRL